MLFALQDTATAAPNVWSVLIALVGALVPVTATICTYLLQRKDTKEIKDETKAQTPVIQTTHTLVNGRMTAVLERMAALEEHNAKLESIIKAGVTAPTVVVPPAQPPADESPKS